MSKHYQSTAKIRVGLGPRGLLWLIFALATAIIGKHIHGSVFWAVIDFLFAPLAWLKWVIYQERPSHGSSNNAAMTTPISMIGADPREAIALFKRIGERRAQEALELRASPEGLLQRFAAWALPGVQRDRLQRALRQPHEL